MVFACTGKPPVPIMPGINIAKAWLTEEKLIAGRAGARKKPDPTFGPAAGNERTRT
jgi:hypothetical protein